MGYDLHITRASDWAESKTAPITESEWLEYLGSDPEMRLDGFAEATTPAGETVRLEASGLAVWTAFSGHGADGNMAWFLWSNGRITVKNPDEEIIDKMCRIATTLSAHVQGDEGELYGSDSTEDELANEPTEPTKKRSLWDRLFG